jgi:hypothetical protein
MSSTLSELKELCPTPMSLRINKSTLVSSFPGESVGKQGGRWHAPFECVSLHNHRLPCHGL